MDQRLNIILLMADQMRADCLGIAGHPDVKTPFLDSQTGREQYFDLVKDPGESHAGIADAQYSDRITHLRKCLIRELEGREEGYSDGEKLIVGRPPQTVLHNVLP